MKFNKHFNLPSEHAFLSASSHAWVNYSEEKLDKVYRNVGARYKGTRIHEFAAEAISLGFKMPRSKKTVNAYINDAIGFKMSPEVILYYSDYAFGTADAIKFSKNKLQIHDLKTGTTKVHFVQLVIYAALFCLEYGINASDIETELRIYQNDEVMVLIPEPEEIIEIMNKIVIFDKRIKAIKQEG